MVENRQSALCSQRDGGVPDQLTSLFRSTPPTSNQIVARIWRFQLYRNHLLMSNTGMGRNGVSSEGPKTAPWKGLFKFFASVPRPSTKWSDVGAIRAFEIAQVSIASVEWDRIQCWAVMD